MYLFVIVAPLALTWAIGREPSDTVAEILATDTGLLASGPPPMVIAVGQQLRERGIAAKRIHTEGFEVV